MEQVLVEGKRMSRPLAGDLVRDARSGDRDAFDRLMVGRFESAFRTALAILGHEADARDATQEVFVKAWRELPSLRDPERFDAWLGRITVNTCRTALRARRRFQGRESSGLVVGDLQEPRSARPRQQLDDHAADLDVLERAFDRLAPSERALLVLHHLDRRPLADIAVALGIPEGTAKSRLHAARRSLGRALEVERR